MAHLDRRKFLLGSAAALGAMGTAAFTPRLIGIDWGREPMRIFNAELQRDEMIAWARDMLQVRNAAMKEITAVTGLDRVSPLRVRRVPARRE